MFLPPVLHHTFWELIPSLCWIFCWDSSRRGTSQNCSCREKITVSKFKDPHIVNIWEGKNLCLIITHLRSNREGVGEHRQEGHCLGDLCFVSFIFKQRLKNPFLLFLLSFRGLYWMTLPHLPSGSREPQPTVWLSRKKPWLLYFCKHFHIWAFVLCTILLTQLSFWVTVPSPFS